jgi:cell division protein FtsQ
MHMAEAGSKRRKQQLMLAAGLSILLLIGWLVAGRQETVREIKTVQVRILPDTGLYFVTREEVLEMVGGGPEGVAGRRVASVRPEMLETQLKALPFVKTCDVYADLSGNLKITLEQKRPLMRIISRSGESYYLAEGGEKLPFSKQFTAHVPVGNGNIAENLADSTHAKTPVLQSLVELATFMDRQAFWSAQIEQVYVDNYSELLLIPRVGNHSIVLGNTDRLPEKMEKLGLFYTKALSKLGWDLYERIDLRYERQVIGVKKSTFNNEAETGAETATAQ